MARLHDMCAIEILHSDGFLRMWGKSLVDMSRELGLSTSPLLAVSPPLTYCVVYWTIKCTKQCFLLLSAWCNFGNSQYTTPPSVCLREAIFKLPQMMNHPILFHPRIFLRILQLLQVVSEKPHKCKQIQQLKKSVPVQAAKLPSFDPSVNTTNAVLMDVDF